jgi:hypothetical protein
VSLILIGVCALILVTWDGSGDEGKVSGGEGFRALLHLPKNPPRAEKHEVVLYYEVLCPFSRDFLDLSFVPTVLQMSKYIRPVLIPYGKANTTTESQY